MYHCPHTISLIYCAFFLLYFWQATRAAEDSKQTKPPASDGNITDSHTITAILRLFHYAPLLVRTVFADDLSFNQACNEAFTTVVNKDLGKSSVMQMLAAYCDNLLKVNYYFFEILMHFL